MSDQIRVICTFDPQASETMPFFLETQELIPNVGFVTKSTLQVASIASVLIQLEGSLDEDFPNTMEPPGP